MKIGYIELSLPEGKVKYKDENLQALEKKDKPKRLHLILLNLLRKSLCILTL